MCEIDSTIPLPAINVAAFPFPPAASGMASREREREREEASSVSALFYTVSELKMRTARVVTRLQSSYSEGEGQQGQREKTETISVCCARQSPCWLTPNQVASSRAALHKHTHTLTHIC